MSLDPFERVSLGRTDVQVQRMGIGTAALGGLFRPVTDAEAAMVLQHAWDAGVRYYDSAPLYGYGLGEERVGRLLAAADPSAWALSTKVGRLLYPMDVIAADPSLEPDRPTVDIPGFDPSEGYFRGTDDRRPVFDYSYDGVMRSLEDSLERTGLPRIDILWLHDPDFHWQEAIDGAVPALSDLRAAGTVGAIGVGMNDAAALARFAREADFDALMCAGRYTLLDQSALDELFPVCERKGTVIVAAGVMNSGLLAKPRKGSHFDYAPAPDSLVDKALAMQAVCDRHGVSLRAAAMQFVFGHPLVVSEVAGVRTVTHVDDAIENLSRPIPAALWEELRAEGLLDARVPTPS
jgi:D-threo-aldose 1-dehydrogenase